MRKKTQASYGKIDAESFYLNINGPCLFPQVSGSSMDYAILIEGMGNIMQTSQAGLAINYVVDDSGTILNIPPNPRSNDNIYDYGQGKVWLKR